MIKVETPKLWIAMSVNKIWNTYYAVKPQMLDDGHWYGFIMNPNTLVSYYEGDWKDSLHQWNGVEWVKV